LLSFSYYTGALAAWYNIIVEREEIRLRQVSTPKSTPLGKSSLQEQRGYDIIIVQ
jgi:hypothetical protein